MEGQSHLRQNQGEKDRERCSPEPRHYCQEHLTMLWWSECQPQLILLSSISPSRGPPPPCPRLWVCLPALRWTFLLAAGLSCGWECNSHPLPLQPPASLSCTAFPDDPSWERGPGTKKALRDHHWNLRDLTPRVLSSINQPTRKHLLSTCRLMVCVHSYFHSFISSFNAS